MQDRDRTRVTNRGAPRASSIPIRTRPEQLAMARKKQAPEPPAERLSQDVQGFQGVYIISVAARLLEMHPQTLRKYERLGLVQPSRTIGMLRLYSEEDIEKLRLIKHLEENLGLNLAGVGFTLDLLAHLLDMLQRFSRMEEAERFFGIVEQEMAQLLRRFNLHLRE